VLSTRSRYRIQLQELVLLLADGVFDARQHLRAAAAAAPSVRLSVVVDSSKTTALIFRSSHSPYASRAAAVVSKRCRATRASDSVSASPGADVGGREAGVRRGRRAMPPRPEKGGEGKAREGKAAALAWSFVESSSSNIASYRSSTPCTARRGTGRRVFVRSWSRCD
jgi:hypothetical protein